MIFRKSNRIDKRQFQTIWDTLARAVNDGGEAEKLLELRHPQVWATLTEIGSRLSTVISLRSAKFADLSKILKSPAEFEITYAIQIGYMLRLVEETVENGQPVRTNNRHLNKSAFVDRVLDYPNNYVHSPLEVSLCEFHSQVAMKDILDDNPHLPSDQIAPMKDEILSATLYGCAAGVIEEQCVA